MKSVLHIDSSPLRPNSVSRNLAAAFLQALRMRVADLDVRHRDLTRDPPPAIDATWADAMFLPPDAHTPEMQRALAPSEIYIGELYAADCYIFSMPMHNFTVPANFKAYIDHCLRPGRLFQTGENGPQGLLHNKRAFVVTSRGGYYHTANPQSDFQEPYLRKVLNFIGVTDIAFVHAEGMDMGADARDAGLRQALEEIQDHVGILAGDFA